MKEKAIEFLEKAEIKSNDFKDEVIYKTVVNNIAELLNKLELQENYNDMLVAELNELKAENDRMQEHLMHNEAELIPLRKDKLRLTKKLEYCYEKTYLILNNLDDTNDVVKLFDAVEEFKPIA